VSFVTNVSSISGLSIFDCPFGFPYRLFKLWTYLMKVIPIGICADSSFPMNGSLSEVWPSDVVCGDGFIADSSIPMNVLAIMFVMYKLSNIVCVVVMLYATNADSSTFHEVYSYTLVVDLLDAALRSIVYKIAICLWCDHWSVTQLMVCYKLILITIETRIIQISSCTDYRKLQS
jgi:hypothetical protein